MAAMRRRDMGPRRMRFESGASGRLAMRAIRVSAGLVRVVLMK